MIRNYIKIALRSIRKHKLFSIINILGLALSISTGLLVLLMLFNLLNYDTFHSHSDRIYRIISRKDHRGPFLATSPMPLKETLLTEYSGIEKVVRLKGLLGGDIAYDEQSIPLFGYYADEDFFNFFGFNLVQGDPVSALREPFSLVLTETAANRLFGNEDPIGKIVTFNDRGLNALGFDLDLKDILLGDFTITGIVKKEKASHIQFELLASMSTLPLLAQKGIDSAPLDDWKNLWSSHLYILLEEGKTEKDVRSILSDVVDGKYAGFENFDIELEPQPFMAITPGKLLGNPVSLRMPIEGLYFLSILVGIIILSACFNYTNMSVARALARSREIALRKINGALRYQIFWQFIMEAIIIALLATLLSIGILQLLKQGFEGLWINRFMSVNLDQQAGIFLLFLAFSIIIGFIAGVIPAWTLSSFRPLSLISRKFSGSFTKKGVFIYKKPTLGKTLIAIQLTLSLFFIITTTLLFFQVKQFANAQYGFDKENIINIPLRGNDYIQFANEFSKWSGIRNISGSSNLPATLVREGTTLKKQDGSGDSLRADYIYGNANFISNLNFKLIAGSNLPSLDEAESVQSIVVNETTTTKLGYELPESILGETFLSNEDDLLMKVVGVVEDFHYDIFSQNIEPLFFQNKPENFRYINVLYEPASLSETLVFLENKWKELDKIHSFKYEFFDQQLAESHAIFGDVLALVGFVSILAIVIASMGLLGMVTYHVESRIKEIGIRKVMGATVNQVGLQISKGFLMLLLAAILIATPLAYFINNLWLQNFAIRVNFNIQILGSSILLMMLLGLLAIGSQTIKAALTNPAITLRDE